MLDKMIIIELLSKEPPYSILYLTPFVAIIALTWIAIKTKVLWTKKRLGTLRQ